MHSGWPCAEHWEGGGLHSDCLPPAPPSLSPCLPQTWGGISHSLASSHLQSRSGQPRGHGPPPGSLTAGVQGPAPKFLFFFFFPKIPMRAAGGRGRGCQGAKYKGRVLFSGHRPAMTGLPGGPVTWTLTVSPCQAAPTRTHTQRGAQPLVDTWLPLGHRAKAWLGNPLPQSRDMAPSPPERMYLAREAPHARLISDIQRHLLATSRAATALPAASLPGGATPTHLGGKGSHSPAPRALKPHRCPFPLQACEGPLANPCKSGLPAPKAWPRSFRSFP